MSNKVFQHYAARKILESKTSTPDKIRALHSISVTCFNVYFLARYFKVKETSIAAVLVKQSNNLIPQPIHPDDIKKPLPVGEVVTTVAGNCELEINYV